MAALQKIRSKGVLLVAVLGLALFAFIAEEFFRSLETTSMMDRNQVGEVYGKKLSIQDFQAMVDEQSEVMKLQLMMQGQDGNLNDQQTEQIREQVWQQFVNNAIIEHESEKVGLYVTDGEVQEALRLGQAQSLQLLAPIFGNQQTGRFDLTQLQAFLKDYKKSLAQAQQAQNGQAVEQIEMIKKLWDFSEKQLRQELLSNKYNMLFAQGFVSNKVAAEMNFNYRNLTKDVEIAALPYSAIDDKEVKLTDEDLKAAYAELKENFYTPVETRDIKVLDVTVTASAEDRAELMKKVQEVETQLRESDDVANLVRTSGSAVPYTKLAMSRAAFEHMADVAKNVDSMAVGSVKPAYYNAQDNTINTIKLIAKTQAPDSVLYRQIACTAATPEARKTQADSILKAINGGASFAEIAKKYGQRSDSVWIASAQYESFGLNDEGADYIAKLNDVAANSAAVISNEQGAVVVQVLDRKNFVTKYNVAVVKCPLNFSKKTYEGELSKLNRFLAANQTIEAFEANAVKNGYILADLPAYSPLQNMLPQSIGGSQSKDAARWIFDEAEAGQISKLYECGRNGDHLLVVAVKACNDEGYMPMDEPQVQEYVKAVATQKKKAEIAANRLKGAKTIADVMKQKGAVEGTLTAQSFLGYPQLMGVNMPEPLLAGAIAKTANGKTSSVVNGSAAAYLFKVVAETKTPGKFDAATEMTQTAREIQQRTVNSVFGYLHLRDAEIADHRYQF